MRSRAGLVSLVVVGLAFAGCGGTNKAASTAARRFSPPPPPPGPPAKSVTYSVKLGSNANGPRTRARARSVHPSGFALVSIKGASNELCWNFSQIKNVIPAPTEAAIEGQLSVGFISAPIEGEGYTPSGCLEKPLTLLRLIEASPHKLYVNIQSRTHPERGLRGRL